MEPNCLTAQNGKFFTTLMPKSCTVYVYKGLLTVLVTGIVLFTASTVLYNDYLPLLTQADHRRPPGTVDGNNLEKEEELEGLLQILEDRLKKYTDERLDWTSYPCNNTNDTSMPCLDETCPGRFSTSARTRLRQVLAARSDLPSTYRSAIASMRKNLTSHQYIFVTAASANHYQEMQGLLMNAFTTLFPRMKDKDYAFVFYDLGLTARQRRLTEKYCRCKVMDFPFSQLPGFMKNVGCYVWKPIIIAALLEKAEYLVWMDTSIRWHRASPLEDLFQRTRERGYQTRFNNGSIAVRTVRSMATFFGDELCQYSPFTEMETGLGFYYNDRFMREAILHPWLSCAFNQTCMCVKDHTKLLLCGNSPPRRYERCHRFEQSSIGMLLSKLFLDQRPVLYVPNNSVHVARGQVMRWFEEWQRCNSSHDNQTSFNQRSSLTN